MLISLITTESLRLVEAKTLLLLKRNVFEKEFNFPILHTQAVLCWVCIYPSQNVEFLSAQRESAWLLPQPCAITLDMTRSVWMTLILGLMVGWVNYPWLCWNTSTGN